jgi:dTDP-glucose 4,6-dehydratase/UDP-glucose 4-epimerase
VNLLILGSEGFIGSNAVKYFISRGHNVYSADIVLKQAKGYIIINPERSDFSTIFVQHKFDACINATGAANVQLSFAHPSVDYVLNTANVFEILNSIKEHSPACRFINLSSAAVYGDAAQLPIKEDTPLRPLSPYGCHKMYSEQICKEFFEFFNVKTISVRIFSAYGEGLQKQIFWDLYKKISVAESEIEVFGTGRESRDFIYIQDLLSALECILEKATFNGTAINVASGVESTIEEAIEFFVQSFNKKIHVRFGGDSKIGDPLNWRADISLLTSLGFKNKFSLQSGINNYCKWLQERKSL